MTGWSQEKCDAFEEAFRAFLNNCRVNSKDKGGGFVLGSGLYEAQERALREILAGLRGDVHDFKILKSRQLGMSTFTRALMVFWMGVHPGVPGALVFDTDLNKENARREIEDMIDNLPSSLRFPKIKARNRYGLLLGNGSKMTFMAAGTRNSRSSGALGASQGLSLVWASEMCSWENDEGIVSLRQALSEVNPDRLYIWESTARGPNIWQDMWDEAKADELNQRAIFIGWWAKDSQQIARSTPAWQKYGTAPPTDDELKRIQEVKARYGWLVTPEQLAWFRQKSDPLGEKEAGAADDGFLQQNQPWTEEEAFILSGSSFFSVEKLTEAARHTRGKFEGYKFYPGSDFVHSDIRPARTIQDVMLKVWENPDPDGCYVVSGDPAFGHDERNDRSAAQVLRCYADGVDQVAEFASASTPTHQFAWLLASLVGWYSQGGKAPVVLIIEINGPGESVWREYGQLKQVVSQGYLRRDAEKKGIADIFNNVRMYFYGRSDSLAPGNSYHWKTTTQLKVAIMERLRDGIHTGTCTVRSADTIHEMRSIIRDGDTIKGDGKKKDDRVFSLAMGIRAWEERLRRGLVAGNRTRAADEAKKRMSVADQYQLFRSNQLQAFFRAKQAGRVQAQLSAAKAGWRYR